MFEVAAMNSRAKSMGYELSKTFEKNLNVLIEHNEANDQKSLEEK